MDTAPPSSAPTTSAASESAPAGEVEHEDAASAVPSDLATAQWGALPEDAALNAGPSEADTSGSGDAAAAVNETAANTSDNELIVSGRVMAGFQWRDRRPENGQVGNAGSSYGFVLRQARLRTELRPNKRVRIVVSADFADALDPTDFSPPPYLRNAYVQFAIEKRWLELRVGRFKRPYSRFELRSVGALPFVGRGLSNDLIVEQGQWGDRAVGAMLRGRVEAARLRWWLSASNPEWRVSGEPDGVDLLARVEWDVNDLIEVGAGGGGKWTEDGTGERVRVWAGGLDARFRYEGLEALGEVLLGQRANVADQPLSMGVIGAINYTAGLSKNVRLQPTLFGEWTDTDTEFTGNDALRLAFGCNLLWKKSFRVMPQLEVIRPLGTVSVSNPWPASERVSLIFSGQM